jgi:hypothetical protein
VHNIASTVLIRLLICGAIYIFIVDSSVSLLLREPQGVLEDRVYFAPSFLAYGPRDSDPSGKPEASISGVAEGSQ